MTAITWDEFLKRAKKEWGDKYKYIYENPESFSWRNGWVKVICNDNCHAPNEATLLRPCNHLVRNRHRNPAGCRKCFQIKDKKHKQKPFSDFLKHARTIHGDKYEYIEKTYDGAKTNMSIICKLHKKVFLQCPDSHLNGGRGCPDCSKDKTIAVSRPSRLKKVIDRLYERTKGRVVIVDESFFSWHSEANFICSEHGEFRDYAFNVLTRGYPCKECNEDRVPQQLTEQDILDRFNEKTGNFEVLQVKGMGGNAELKIRCYDCSRKDFTVKMTNTYTKDYACGVCQRKKSEQYRKSKVRQYIKNNQDARFKSWLERSIEYHNHKYDYSLVRYKNQHDKVEIICPSHGVFMQKPDAHLKSGCRKCADEKLHGLYTKAFFERFPEQKAVCANLYYIKIIHEKYSFYKVGITKNSIKNRFGGVSKSVFKISPISIKKTTLYKAYKAEEALLANLSSPNKLLDDKEFVGELRDSTIGTTEIFCKPLSDFDIEKYFN